MARSNVHTGLRPISTSPASRTGASKKRSAHSQNSNQQRNSDLGAAGDFHLPRIAPALRLVVVGAEAHDRACDPLADRGTKPFIRGDNVIKLAQARQTV